MMTLICAVADRLSIDFRRKEDVGDSGSSSDAASDAEPEDEEVAEEDEFADLSGNA